MLRARMYIVSGPGVIQSRKLARRKAGRSWVPSMRIDLPEWIERPISGEETPPHGSAGALPGQAEGCIFSARRSDIR
jgi:hypothetical protein